MRGWTLAQKTQLAFQTLSELTGRSVSFLNAEYEGALHHDWSEDPWTYGALQSGIRAARQILD